MHKLQEGIGGRDRDRTCDLMLAKHALSQLSYTPTFTALSILLYLARFENSETSRVSTQPKIDRPANHHQLAYICERRFHRRANPAFARQVAPDFYLSIPTTFFGNRFASSFVMPKLSAISDAGFPASHFEIEISSNVGLLNSAKNFVGSLPICST